MGLSHKIMFRLFSAAEKKKRRQESTTLYRRLLPPDRKGSHSNATIKRTFSIGITILLHLCCIYAHWRKTPEGKYPAWPLLALFLSVISAVRFLIWIEQRKRMDCTIFPESGGSFNRYQWKILLLEIISGTKRRLIKIEKTYLKMRNFALLINQLVFFSLCERVFLEDHRQHITSFYTLMFFNVVAYCVAYIKELIQREDWSIYVKIAKGSNVRHLAMSATNIVLEWTKAIAFVVTVVFILLVCGLEEGLKNYTPSALYLLATGLYFIISEKVFVQLICQVFEKLKFGCFESMENLYSPLMIKGTQIVLSLIMTIACGMLGHLRISCFSSFTNIRAKYKELDDEHWQPLRRELARLIGFRCANLEEIRRHDDVCAICLNPMNTARVTPCSHFFHAACLRRCLAEASLKCPMCKYQLSMEYYTF